MSFLDNLENNLKALEATEAAGMDDRKRREAEKRDAIAAAPWAEKLKSSPWVTKFMRDLTRAGFSRRTKINFVWIDRILRAEALDERLELVPTPRGVEAVFGETRLPVDLDGDPDELMNQWLEVIDRRKQERDAVPVPSFDDEE
ncbi:MAG TPA: hypothetical protein VHC90_05300 [Bryobacteraceae bacterium]|nr:hypothetical protein [Bryobacteraceae bacterium]